VTAASIAPLPGAVDRSSIARRLRQRLLMIQLVGGMGQSIALTVSALVSVDLMGHGAAGVGTAASIFGGGVAGRLLSERMRTGGRRPNLTLGYLVACLGGLSAVAAVELGAWPLFIVASIAFGAGTGSNQLLRWAATDVADPDNIASSVGLVVWGSTVGSVVAPNLGKPVQRLAIEAGLEGYSGPFLFAVGVFFVAMIVVWFGLRPDPSSLALALGSLPAKAAARLSPTLAIASLVTAHAVMVAVMGVTSVHLKDHGHGLGAVGIVISAHVLGMFAFSPIVGRLADRYGRVEVIAAGLAIESLAFVVNLALQADSPETATPGLFLLGLGWSAAYVAASGEVSASGGVVAQGRSELTQGVVAAACVLAAGPVLDRAGYPTLNVVALVVSGAVLAIVVPHLRRRAKSAAV
jgi:MFS family permease